jgi:hypothetical protein
MLGPANLNFKKLNCYQMLMFLERGREAQERPRRG